MVGESGPRSDLKDFTEVMEELRVMVDGPAATPAGSVCTDPCREGEDRARLDGGVWRRLEGWISGSRSSVSEGGRKGHKGYLEGQYGVMETVENSGRPNEEKDSEETAVPSRASAAGAVADAFVSAAPVVVMLEDVVRKEVYG